MPVTLADLVLRSGPLRPPSVRVSSPNPCTPSITWLILRNGRVCGKDIDQIGELFRLFWFVTNPL